MHQFNVLMIVTTDYTFLLTNQQLRNGYITRNVYFRRYVDIKVSIQFEHKDNKRLTKHTDSEMA